MSEATPSPPPQGGAPEPGEPPYYLAARFAGEADAGQAYVRAHEAILAAQPCDLGGWRLQLAQVWHVVLLGEAPPPDLDQRLRQILSRGELVALPPPLLARLAERRARARQRGPRIERHYWPGQPL
jgi:hypothetical protein